MVALLKTQNVTEKQRSNEWYTPARYIEAARKVMGGIDLDPASCELANATVRASRYYTQAENGLLQPWYGNVWLNPPYKIDKSLPNEQRSTVGKWVHKLVEEYRSGSAKQAIMLVTSQMNARWISALWDYSICFPSHNLRFFVPYGSAKKSRQGRMTDGHIFGSMFVYFGLNESKFIEVFSEFGPIIPANVAIRGQEVTPIQLWEVQP